MKKWMIVLPLNLLMAGGLAAADTELTRLTVREEAGVERKNEPVTVGVPFAEGILPDVTGLELRDDAGKKIPAQFLEVSKWRTAKGGVRWTQVDFLMSVPANGAKELAVVRAEVPAEQAKSGLQAVLKDNAVTVITGPAKFVVKGAGFTGFDSVWLDPEGKGDFSDANLIVKSGPASGGRVEGGGKVFSSAADPAGTVELESVGPRKVVVLAKGSHMNGGEKRFDYAVRFYAFADSPVVKVSYTFINRQGNGAGDMIELDGLSMGLATVQGKPEVLLGTDSEPWAGLADAQPVSILQKASDEFVVMAGSDEKGRGRGKSVKPMSLGWIDAGGAGKHVACGLRWFWQMHPKELAVAPDGTVSVGMYPKSIGKTLDIYMGQSRTHYMTFLFHKGMSKKDLNGFFIASQRPLRPWAPMKYYSRETTSPGFTAESSSEMFVPDRLEIVQGLDRKMESSLDSIVKKLDGHTYEGYTVDSYGFHAWGDTFHWAWPKQEKAPKDTPEWHVSWEGNYYDYPHLCLMQMFRSGNMNYYWQAFEPNVIHVRDVFTCQYHPQKELCGACRYCPPRNHVAMDDGKPYVSNEFNHNKSQSLFAHWYLTGDWRSREVLELMMNNGLNNHAADTGFANRGIGAHMALLRESWELTGEQKYRDRILQLLKNVGSELESKQGEFNKGPDPGIGQEGLVYAHMATGDAYAGKLLRLVSDRWMKKDRSNPSSALSLAYCGVIFGDEKLKEQAWKCVAKAGGSKRPKDLAEPNRNIPYALYFLSNACTNRSVIASVPEGAGK